MKKGKAPARSRKVGWHNYGYRIAYLYRPYGNSQGSSLLRSESSKSMQTLLIVVNWKNQLVFNNKELNTQLLCGTDSRCVASKSIKTSAIWLTHRRLVRWIENTEAIKVKMAQHHIECNDPTSWSVFFSISVFSTFRTSLPPYRTSENVELQHVTQRGLHGFDHHAKSRCKKIDVGIFGMATPIFDMA
jgi:hypothetical protein